MKKNCPDSSGGNDIRPGACDPVYGCPPPTEIVCIQVDKIYQECKNIQVNEVKIVVDRQSIVTDAICLGVKLLSVECIPVNTGRIKVVFCYCIRTRLIFENGASEIVEKIIDEEKTFFLSRAGEEGLQEKCEIYLECLECFVDKVKDLDPYNDSLVNTDNNSSLFRSKIICCVGKLILLKLFAHVQLMIPAYGFCPQPPDCEEVEFICPDYEPGWPPYPPQDR